MRTNVLTMPVALIMSAGLFAGAAMAPAPAAAQPYPYGGPGYYGPSYYYYNGRWVDQRRWEAQRDREWRRNSYNRYRRDRGDNTDALAAGIIGFALGAAILGSQNDASRAYGYRSDRQHIASCRARYRSYDAASNTFLGNDGYRHYCVG
jgi:hypothetical protein